MSSGAKGPTAKTKSQKNTAAAAAAAIVCSDGLQLHSKIKLIRINCVVVNSSVHRGSLDGWRILLARFNLRRSHSAIQAAIAVVATCAIAEEEYQLALPFIRRQYRDRIQPVAAMLPSERTESAQNFSDRFTLNRESVFSSSSHPTTSDAKTAKPL